MTQNTQNPADTNPVLFVDTEGASAAIENLLATANPLNHPLNHPLSKPLGQSQIGNQRINAMAALPKLNISLDDLFAAVTPKLLEGKAAQAEADAKSAELDALRKEMAKRRKAAAGTRDSGGLTFNQRESLRAQVQKWEAESVFIPNAWVLMVQEDTCLGCMQTHKRVLGVYQHQYRETNQRDTRMVLWSAENGQDLAEGPMAKLPRHIQTVANSTLICQECAFESGFVGEAPEVRDEAIQQAHNPNVEAVITLEGEVLALRREKEVLAVEYRTIRSLVVQEKQKLGRFQQLTKSASQRFGLKV